MSDAFDFLTMDFFTRASVFPGSLGTFRYRFQRTGWMGDGEIQAWAYENVCFELAEHKETETFPWTEEGVAGTKAGGAGDGALPDSLSAGKDGYGELDALEGEEGYVHRRTIGDAFEEGGGRF